MKNTLVPPILFLLVSCAARSQDIDVAKIGVHGTVVPQISSTASGSREVIGGSALKGTYVAGDATLEVQAASAIPTLLGIRTPDGVNGQLGGISVTSSAVALASHAQGTGPAVDLAFDVAGARRARLTTSGHYIPHVDNVSDLGDISLRWRDLRISREALIGINGSQAGTVTLQTGTLGLSASVVGLNNAGTAAFQFAGHLQPSVDNTFDSGAATIQWRATRSREFIAGRPAVTQGQLTLRNATDSTEWTLAGVSVSATGGASVTGHTQPSVDNTFDLGGATLQWKVVRSREFIAGRPALTQGALTLRNATDSTEWAIAGVSVGGSGGGSVSGHTQPSVNITWDLGSGTPLRWRKLWVQDIDLSGTCTGCPGGGDSITVNATAAADANFNNTAPLAPADGVNVRWQIDILTAPDNVSANLQFATDALSGAVSTAAQDFSGTKTFRGGVKIGLASTATATARFEHAAHAFFTEFRSDGSTTESKTYLWPAAGPTGSNQFLTATSASPSVMSWVAAVPATRTISTTSPITGGGDLSADRTFACATCVTTDTIQTITAAKTISATLSTNAVTPTADNTYAIGGDTAAYSAIYGRTLQLGRTTATSAIGTLNIVDAGGSTRSILGGASGAINIGAHWNPNINNTYALGSTSLRWAELDVVTINASGNISNLVDVNFATGFARFDGGYRVGGEEVVDNTGALKPSGACKIDSISGAPAGACTTCEVRLRTDGGTSTTLYVCEAGAWVAK